MDVLEKRLRGRNTETDEAIERRIGNARNELDFGLEGGNFDEVVVNDDLNAAFYRLRIILEAWFPHLNQVQIKS